MDAKEKSVCNLTISDMSCASCVAHIQDDLLKTDGISEAVINFAIGTGKIHYDSTKIKPDQIIQTIKSTGYTATLNESEHSHDHQDHGSHGGHAHHAKSEGTKVIHSRRNNLIISAILSVIILSLSFIIDLPGEHYIMAILSLIILASSGREFYLRGIPSLLRGRPGMNSLVAISLGAAFIYSSYNVFFANPKNEYFMDVAIISTFILLGRYLEALAKGRASNAIKKLLTLSAKVAHRITGKDETTDVPVDQVLKEDHLLVKPGEKIPVDGLIIKGKATIDESMVTGESIPVDKEEGSQVIGATINGNTTFTMKAEKVGKETMLAQIVKLVEEAQMSRAPIQKLVDIISGYFVWGVIILATLTFSGWTLAGAEFGEAFIYTVAVLIIACPCALGLATPISIIVGSGKGASLGILLKRAESLEKMHKVTTICFDKTGTITRGHPEVHEFKSVNGEKNKNLGIALSLEKQSEHPLAKSIVDYCKQTEFEKYASPENFEAITGKGVKGTVNDKLYFLGSLNFIQESKISFDQVKKDFDQLQEHGNTILILFSKTEVLAYFGVKDQIKESSRLAIKLLKENGIKPIMVTGDHSRVAHAIASEVGIQEIHAEVTPADKVAVVRDIQEAGSIVAMVGDGINDSPALAQADIGIAMGTGTDIAMESGDIVLVKGDLLKAIEAIELSSATYRNIKQNLFWAFVYNSIAIPFAALGFLTPIISSLAMAISSVSVVMNALRLRRFKVK